MVRQMRRKQKLEVKGEEGRRKGGKKGVREKWL